MSKLVVESLTGATRDGGPLGYGRAPSNDVHPWFSRVSVSEVHIPHGSSIECSMLHDHPVIRILFGAKWTAHTADGVFDYFPKERGQTLYFGPQTRRMQLVVHGSFKVITLNLAAGGATAMGGPDPQATLDRILDYDKLVGHGRLSSRFAAQATPLEWIETLEDEIRRFVELRGVREPDRLTQAFELACLTDPGQPLAEFAAQNGTTPRTLERTIKRDFGITPKQVQRRARALDMAAMLLGVTIKAEEEMFRLRYFDQSHMTREMRHFFDLTPGQMEKRAHPLLRISVEMRQARRVEALKLVGSDQIKPWRDPKAEPARQ